jgi:molecular chaperone GrpE
MKKEEQETNADQGPAEAAAGPQGTVDQGKPGGAPAASAQQQQDQPAPAQPPTPAPPQPHPAEERLIRLKADFDNLRRRFERERQEMVVQSNERLIRELLPVLDHFELAVDAATQHKTDKAVQDGFGMVYDQFVSAMSGFGLKPVEAQGKPFDPNVHEAIAQQPSADVPEHIVMLQTRRGYMLGERLLRPAQVIVSGGPAKPAAAPETAKE